MANSHHSEDVLAVAAALLVQRGFKQADTAPILGVAAATITRRLQRAEKKGWYSPNPTVFLRNIPRALLRQARELIARWDLEENLSLLAGVRCRVSVVAPRAMRMFGSIAGPMVLEHMRDATGRGTVIKVGIAWGKAVAAVVDGLWYAFPEPPFAKGTLSLFPVCGEPLYVATHLHAFSSSLLATRLGEALIGDASDQPSLAGVGAYLPTNLPRGAAEGTRAFLATVPGYRKIVGADGNGLLAELDILLTGIGVPRTGIDGHAYGVFLAERMAAEKIDEATLERLVFGDIAGVLIARPGLSRTDRALVERLNRGWTGLTLDDIKACVTRANQRGFGGVIVVSQHGPKHELVHELVRLGLVNHLVLNRSAAHSVLEMTTTAVAGAGTGFGGAP